MNFDVSLNLFEIVMKLNGPIEPIGESQEDARRLENIKQLIELTDSLLFEIKRAARYVNNHQDSMHAIGQCANKFLCEIKDEY